MSPSAASARRLPRARHEHLLREIELRGAVRVATAASELGVNEVTIRRDIIALEKAGRLARVHGGAISADTPTIPTAARAIVGLVLPGAGSHFPDVVRGAEASPYGRRCRLIFASTKYRSSVEERQLERLVELGAQGIIVAPSLRDRSIPDLVASLAEMPVPLVLIERDLEDSTPLARYDWVRTDQVRGTVLALEHLAALGHRRIGLALLDRTPAAPAIREGYAQAAARLELAPAPVRPLPKDEGEADDPTDRALRAFLEACLDAGVRAALVHTDFHASRLVEIALDLGVSVPEDFAVVAHDDEFAELAMVPLTAVSPPGREIGRLAVDTLFERIRTEAPDRMPPRHIQLVPHLAVRASCGAHRQQSDDGRPTSVTTG